ncbi:unnamed protein product [Cuscuta epithymum]|uniref:Uncharacterized protein n=1 Tax=Cuscuta epithymum TaxID=186058 RepID=A0AAV0CSY3_9ASTE|nr:unnamed protein product [Cuscuta epithymum]
MVQHTMGRDLAGSGVRACGFEHGFHRHNFSSKFFVQSGNAAGICILPMAEEKITFDEKTVQSAIESTWFGSNVLDPICVLDIHYGHSNQDCVSGERVDDRWGYWLVLFHEILQGQKLVEIQPC